MCQCKSGYYTTEERDQASNCSLLKYEPDPSGVRIHFESKGLGNFCVNMGAYNY
jgi:hypothetical protein